MRSQASLDLGVADQGGRAGGRRGQGQRQACEEAGDGPHAAVPRVARCGVSCLMGASEA